MVRQKSSKSTSTALPPKPAKKSTSAKEKKQPGLLAQTAATAAGVGVGSAVGHAVGHSLVGGSNDGKKADEKKESSPSKKCEVEWESYMRCMKESRDDQACKSLMDKFKECSKK